MRGLSLPIVQVTRTLKPDAPARAATPELSDAACENGDMFHDNENDAPARASETGGNVRCGQTQTCGTYATGEARPSAVRYRYRLEQYTVERLKDAWWILSDAVKKQGPFATAQDVCIAIARELCTELSNRHHALSSFHGVKPVDPLYGLPEAPQLYQPRTVGDAP